MIRDEAEQFFFIRSMPGSFFGNTDGSCSTSVTVADRKVLSLCQPVDEAGIEGISRSQSIGYLNLVAWAEAFFISRVYG